MKKDIENRLIKFSVRNYELTGKIMKNDYSAYLSNQLIRSSTSAALNYGEAQGAETTKDFIHKIGVVIKELRESRVNLKIIKESLLCKDLNNLDSLLLENDELIAIFYATIKTSRERLTSGEL
jgi:four helix bundle protein